MSEVQIKSMSPTHEAIARWLLENPGSKRMGECAEHFKVSRPWLSVVIHSDAFRAYISKLQDDANAAVIHDIPAKLRGVAAMAIDGLAEAVMAASDANDRLMHREFLAETVDMTLQHLGYDAKKPPAPAQLNQQNNFFIGPVPAKTLEDARAKLLTMETPSGLPAASELPACIEGQSSQV